ncbi:MAG TPA: hypothetical protein VFC02_15360 [Anaerolineales bacterium]|nr:hypothetical protein [Anaerolineales bacterium]
MLKTKYIISTLLAVTLLFAQVGLVAAAPTTQDTTPITGTIQSIATETDTNGVTTVLVTLLDDLGATQTVRLSVDTAVALGLVTVDPVSNEVVVDETQVGQAVEIDPTTVIPDEPTTEEPIHPIAALLAAFFGEEGSVVNSYHEDGFGFGVIAQALWMSKNLNDDASLAGLILEAKKSGDYSAFTLPDGSTPTNWGQFKKAALEKKNNLGVIVSGQADSDETLNPSAEQDHGNGKNKNKDKGRGRNNHHRP